MTDTPLKTSGWGPFPLLGERRRRRQSMEEAAQLINALTSPEPTNASQSSDLNTALSTDISEKQNHPDTPEKPTSHGPNPTDEVIQWAAKNEHEVRPIKKMSQNLENKETPTEIVKVERISLEKPNVVSVYNRRSQTTQNFAYIVPPEEKGNVLSHILRANHRGKTIIYVDDEYIATNLATKLTSQGFAAAVLNAGRGVREEPLREFHQGKIDTLITLDFPVPAYVSDITHIIHFRCPDNSSKYVSPFIGLVDQGTVVTLLDKTEIPRWKVINDSLNIGIPDPVEVNSASKTLHTDLNISPKAKGGIHQSQHVDPEARNGA